MRSNVLPKTAKTRLSGAVAVLCLLLAAGAAGAEPLTEVSSAGPGNRAVDGTISPAAEPSEAQQGVATAPGGAAQVSSLKKNEEWPPYLDVAYQLTYWDKAEIKKWREEVEARFNQRLSDYIVTWDAALMQPTAADLGVPPEKGEVPYGEQDYLRLAAAQTLVYLETDDRESLNGAERAIDRLRGKSAMPRVAYWLGFVKALQALENKDSAAFVGQVYSVWNDALRYAETASIAGKGAAGKSAEAAGNASIPHLYRNVVSLVAGRAIIDRKVGGLDALGPLFAMLKDRDLEETAADGRFLTTMVQRVNEILIAPDLDRWRLNFAVALIEARRLQRVAEAKLDTEGMSEEARKNFEQSREYFGQALRWSASRRSSGAVSVMADYLDITSFAVQRLLDRENAGAPSVHAYFSTLPGHEGAVTLGEAMDAFGYLAARKDWEKAGYGNQESYRPSLHRLWRAIMELSLWNGDYYLAQLKAGDKPNPIPIVASLEGALNPYVDFFRAQTESGAADVVPALAYFGAAEAAEKLSYAYRLSDRHSVGQASYNQWFMNRLLAVELYPFDAALVAETASTLRHDGRYGLFIDYFMPLAERFKRSTVLRSMYASETESRKNGAPVPLIGVATYVAAVDDAFAVSGQDPGQLQGPGKGPVAPAAQLATLRRDLQRNPEHETHKLLKAFYQEELGNHPPFIRLMKNPSRMDRE